MKILEIIETVDTEDKENRSFPDWEDFASLFEIYSDYDYDKFTKGLTSYFFSKWYCTDTHVGGRVYFLGDEPVAVSWQSGRKSDEEIKFLSVDSLNKVKDFMFKCCTQKDDYTGLIANVDEDWGLGYKVSYGSQLLRDDCIYQPTNEAVTIIKKFTRHDQVDKWGTVVVRFDDSKIARAVPLGDLLFGFGK
ncbi:hypothetical protein ACFL2R_01180 [Patescibacteria group bacterium]